MGNFAKNLGSLLLSGEPCSMMESPSDDAVRTPLLPMLQRPRGGRLHLPAHGGGPGLPRALQRLLRSRPGTWDLPELPEIGGPLEPEGAVQESQAWAAEAYGATYCWYGVNGASGMLQAALLAMVKPGEAVLVPRNAHRSLIQACALGGLRPVLFDLPFLEDRGHVDAFDLSWISRVLASLGEQGDHPVAAVMVQPTYHGYATDPSPLIQAFHQHGLPVLVDEAHGAHFLPRVDPGLPRSALHAGADLVVHSLHKSSTGLGQTAVLWLQGERVDAAAVQRTLGWLQTTSPSALLLASCEASLADWQSRSGRRTLSRRLQWARALGDTLRARQLPLLATTDPLRLVLHTAAIGVNGLDADEWLMDRGLVAELPEPGCLTFCLGFAPRSRLAGLIERRWHQLRESAGPRDPLPLFEPAPLPLLSTTVMPVAEAWASSSRDVSWTDALGAVSAQLVCPYPPGIPLLIPGEQLDFARAHWLERQCRLWPGQISSRVKIVA